MRIKKNVPYDWEFDVFCRDCKNVIVVEEPEDLQKEVKDGQEMFCLICPVCGCEIWFDGIMGHTLSSDFRKRVQTKKKNYLETALEACEKFNEEFEGTFDKL